MEQINIRVEKEINELVTYLAKRKQIPKAVYAKDVDLPMTKFL